MLGRHVRDVMRRDGHGRPSRHRLAGPARRGVRPRRLRTRARADARGRRALAHPVAALGTEQGDGAGPAPAPPGARRDRHRLEDRLRPQRPRLPRHRAVPGLADLVRGRRPRRRLRRRPRPAQRPPTAVRGATGRRRAAPHRAAPHSHPPRPRGPRPAIRSARGSIRACRPCAATSARRRGWTAICPSSRRMRRRRTRDRRTINCAGQPLPTR